MSFSEITPSTRVRPCLYNGSWVPLAVRLVSECFGSVVSASDCFLSVVQTQLGYFLNPHGPHSALNQVTK